jgi:hypothetical protein
MDFLVPGEVFGVVHHYVIDGEHCDESTVAARVDMPGGGALPDRFLLQLEGGLVELVDFCLVRL